MNKGILRISFDDAKRLILKEKPELKDVELYINFADVDNKRGEVEFQFTTSKPVEGASYEVSDGSVQTRRIGINFEETIGENTSDIEENNLIELYTNVVKARKIDEELTAYNCKYDIEDYYGFTDLNAYRSLCDAYLDSINIFVNISSYEASRKLVLQTTLSNLQSEYKAIYTLATKIAKNFANTKNGDYICISEYKYLQLIMADITRVIDKVERY